MSRHRPLLTLTILVAGISIAHADSVKFTSRELFRIPFGKESQALGAQVKEGNFLIPRDFSIDGDEHFYIYDSNKHRIARYSGTGAYEMGINYPETAKQVFAHPDGKKNLWLLVSDPGRGLYYGVYDEKGRKLHEGIFGQFNNFRLHVDDDATLHVIVTSDKNPAAAQTYLLDQETLLMKKENVARPPEDHHHLRKSDKDYFIDAVPGAAAGDSKHEMKITDSNHRQVGSIRGTVIYVTEEGEIYSRVGDRDINIYDVKGSLIGKVKLEGLAAACASVRFDGAGNIYELDGIPDLDHGYTPNMPGMRLLVWERH